jgi:hypothetical protein
LAASSRQVCSNRFDHPTRLIATKTPVRTV